MKQIFVLDAGSPSDLGFGFVAINNAYGTGTNPYLTRINAYRNVGARAVFTNKCTYQLKFRVSTWVCRHDVPGREGVYETLAELYAAGFQPPFAYTPTGSDAMTYTDVSSSPFQNPLWCYHFKCVSKKSYVLMPYRQKTESLLINKRRPGLGVGAINADDPNAGTAKLACSKSYNIATCVKLIEVYGELVNDAVAAPSTSFFNAPSVLAVQYFEEMEVAGCQAGTRYLNVGDGSLPTPESALTGQPWNYMFPTASSSSSLGTSTILGTLTSGL